MLQRFYLILGFGTLLISLTMFVFFTRNEYGLILLDFLWTSNHTEWVWKSDNKRIFFQFLNIFIGKSSYSRLAAKVDIEKILFNWDCEKLVSFNFLQKDKIQFIWGFVSTFVWNRTNSNNVDRYNDKTAFNSLRVSCLFFLNGYAN